jgi:hypothetical protein
MNIMNTMVIAAADCLQELLDDYEAAETEGSGPQHSVY